MSTATKQCGTCSLCCKLLAIPELEKPVNEWCKHCKPGNGGCTIYNKPEKPAVCDAYKCGWLASHSFDDRWFPAKCKFLMEMHGDVLRIFVDPGFPNAWRKEPYYSALMALADTQKVAIHIGARGNNNRWIILKYQGVNECEIVGQPGEERARITLAA
jgi:hypothetical protein